MNKYDEWNEIKKQTSIKDRKLGIKPREIFWVKIGQNLGSEEYGKDKDFTRPVVIVRKLTHDLFVGIPLTSSLKDNDYFHKFSYTNNTFSIKRVLNKIGMVNKEDFEKIIVKAKSLINPI